MMQPISVLHLYTIGIGPSSSHTVGPMRAGHSFITTLAAAGLLGSVHEVQVHLYGSLALTGKGHGTDKAVLLGLEGELPEVVDVDRVSERVERIRSSRSLNLAGIRMIPFDEATGLQFHRLETLPLHSNGMRFVALDSGGRELLARTCYSVGGGFVVNDPLDATAEGATTSPAQPYPLISGESMLRHAAATGLSVSELTLRNENAWRPEHETRAALLKVWSAMQSCVRRGCETEGILPGGLQVQRRAPGIYRKLVRVQDATNHDPLHMMDWVSLWAMAVNEENAAGGRVVTAPTNGAAGILPSVLHYYVRTSRKADDESVVRFLLTAGAIGILYKLNASISGAEVGCQGEVGVACSMAAGALCEALGGSVAQVENAAEIGMEHNLGLTCDPIGGLVQVPCIERNAMGAVKAISAARLALRGDGTHRVSLDKVIATMRSTGADMSAKYKETSRGGLAVNLIEC